MNTLPRTVDVQGDYVVELNNSYIDTDGEVTVDVEDVLDLIDPEAVRAYYKSVANGSPKKVINEEIESLRNFSSDSIIEHLKDEYMRGAFSDINFKKLFDILK